MRRFVLFLPLVFLSALAAAAPAITDPGKLVSRTRAAAPSLQLDKLLMNRAVGGGRWPAAAWSPDGLTVATVLNLAGRHNLWLVPSSGGWPVQLTAGDQRELAPVFSPDGKWILFESDYDGDEQWDLHRVSPLTGEEQNLTHTREVAETGAVFSPDGRQIAYAAKPRDRPSWEIEVLDLATRATRRLTAGTPADHSNTAPRWSPDGTRLAYTRYRADEKDADLYVVDLKSGHSTLLTAHTGARTAFAQGWSPDGRKLLVTSNAGNGYENVALLDVATRVIDFVSADHAELTAGCFSGDGKAVYWTANHDGSLEVVRFDVATRRTETLPLRAGLNDLAGLPSTLSPDGTRLLVYHEGADTPRELWIHSLADGKSHALTHAFFGGIHSENMVEPQLVHYPSKDGKWQISAFVYLPDNILRDRRHPGIVIVHGGPAAQAMNDFEPLTQYLVNQGYVVISPNYRGSTGYGRAFVDANQKDMGGGDLSDVVAGADFVERSGYVDPHKWVIFGRSYGGYMTMMGVTKTPERWAAGVAVVPFVNYFTEVKAEDPELREYDLATMGDPVKDEALWRDRSPIFFTDRIRAPLLLIAGGQDPRCPKEEAQQVADALERRHQAHELKIYADEGHSFGRLENVIDAHHRMVEFLRKHVPPPSPSR